MYILATNIRARPRAADIAGNRPRSKYSNMPVDNITIDYLMTETVDIFQYRERVIFYTIQYIILQFTRI